MELMVLTSETSTNQVADGIPSSSVAADLAGNVAVDVSCTSDAAVLGRCGLLRQSEPVRRVAWEGCSVLLDINDGDRLVFARLSPAATVKIGSKKCSLRPLIGCPFGSKFCVGSGPGGNATLVRCIYSSTAPSHDESMQDTAEGELPNDCRDNRSLVDNNTAQQLSSDDIDEMRRNGATGDEIVDALIANSSTFGTKTVFSQEKYKLRKQKKYAPKVLLRRPSSRSICETYFKKHPARIGFLRIDTLSLLLSMANVGPYSDVLVVDMVGGVLVGAVAERLGGTGYVCSTFFGDKPNNIDIARMFNFSSDICSRIVRIPLNELRSQESSISECCIANSDTVQPVNMEPNSVPDEHKPTASKLNAIDVAYSVSPSELPVDENDYMNSNDCRDDGHNSQLSDLKSVKAGGGVRPSPEIIQSWKEHGFTSLIVAAPEMGSGVENFVRDLLPLLSYSAPFAIYHQYIQPLSICMNNLQPSKLAIGLRISEPWVREYQVLPSRTHPFMQMDAFGGYILSGIRTCAVSGGVQENSKSK